MEAGTVLTDSHRIFCHLPVQQLVCTAVFIVDCIKAAGSDTASAALTFVVIDNRFSIQICNRIASALMCTASAAAAFFQIDSRLSAGMLLHLACTAAAAHADIFDGTAKSGRFMSLKVRQADKISASIIARPIFGAGQYSAFGTGTSTSSVPRRPSPIKI